jgi:hypothetical protein
MRDAAAGGEGGSDGKAKIVRFMDISPSNDFL